MVIAEPVSDVALRGTLLLADGTRFEGIGLGAPGMTTGEMVFTTAMTGYGEAMTDPSYRGQILMFTYPLIGNYGILPNREQSAEVHPSGIILSTLSSSWEGREPLDTYLRERGVPAIVDVDTRAVARAIRSHGAMPAAISVHAPDAAPTVAQLQSALAADAYDSTDFVSETTVSAPETYGPGACRVVVLDCGNKRDVTDQLVQRQTTVTIVPAHTTAEEILALMPDGVVISNGPGNPATATASIETVKGLYGRVPMFGICLGHQLLALAAGATTFKLPFGHRGANHPVIDTETGRAFITTQNHGYTVDPDTLPDELLVSHRNVNDGTVEGLRHRSLPIRSVQFHPEGAPGPTDAGVLLDEWLEVVSSGS